MAVALKTFLLLSILFIIPFLSSGRIEKGFKSQVQIENDSMQFPEVSLVEQGGIRMMDERKLLVPVLDYDDVGANTRHDPPRKKPGHP